MGARTCHRVRRFFKSLAALVVLAPAVSLVTTAVSLLAGPSPIAAAYEPDVQAGGFDRCQAPTVTTMYKYWQTLDTYWWMGIYLPSGETKGCSQPNLSTSWQHAVTHITATGEGFDLGLIFSGYQPECVTPTLHITPSERFPSNATAYYWGKSSATIAIKTAKNLTFGGGAIYFDMEPFNNSTSGCRTGAKNFISGWDYELSHSGYLGGVYALYDEVATFDFGNVPYAVWASINTPTNPSVNTIPDITGLWTGHQRLKQYAHTEPTSVTGVTTREAVDWDCSTAPLNGASDWHVGCHKT